MQRVLGALTGITVQVLPIYRAYYDGDAWGRLTGTADRSIFKKKEGTSDCQELLCQICGRQKSRETERASLAPHTHYAPRSQPSTSDNPHIGATDGHKRRGGALETTANGLVLDSAREDHQKHPHACHPHPQDDAATPAVTGTQPRLQAGKGAAANRGTSRAVKAVSRVNRVSVSRVVKGVLGRIRARRRFKHPTTGRSDPHAPPQPQVLRILRVDLQPPDKALGTRPQIILPTQTSQPQPDLLGNMDTATETVSEVVEGVVAEVVPLRAQDPHRRPTQLHASFVDLPSQTHR